MWESRYFGWRQSLTVRWCFSMVEWTHCREQVSFVDIKRHRILSFKLSVILSKFPAFTLRLYLLLFECLRTIELYVVNYIDMSQAKRGLKIDINNWVILCCVCLIDHHICPIWFIKRHISRNQMQKNPIGFTRIFLPFHSIKHFSQI